MRAFASVWFGFTLGTFTFSLLTGEGTWWLLGAAVLMALPPFLEQRVER